MQFLQNMLCMTQLEYIPQVWFWGHSVGVIPLPGPIKILYYIFGSSTTWDKSTTHPKFDQTWARTHDLQIMTAHFMSLRRLLYNHSAISDLQLRRFVHGDTISYNKVCG